MPIMISGSWRGHEIDLRQQTTCSVRDIIDAPSSATAAFEASSCQSRKDQAAILEQDRILDSTSHHDMDMRWHRRTSPEYRCLDGLTVQQGMIPSVSADR
jgi:hypothetical protein